MVCNAKCEKGCTRGEADQRIAELEAALRELLDTFNPETRMDDVGLIWGRAAKALEGKRH